MHDDFALFNAQRQEDWEKWAGRNVAATDSSVALATTPTLRNRELDVGCADIAPVWNGNLLVLDEEGDLTVYVTEDSRRVRLDLQHRERITSPTMIGATRASLYLIDGENGMVGEFSRRKRRLERTSEGVVDPVAAVGSETTLYVLDRGAGEGGGFVLSLAPNTDPERVVENLEQPLAITHDGERLYVLDDRSDGPVLLELDPTDGSKAEIEINLPEAFVPEHVTALTARELLLSGTEDGEPTAILYDTDEQKTMVEITTEASFSGLASVATDRPVGYGWTGSGRVWLFEKAFENRKDPENTRYEGYLIGRFDSGERNLEWHRIAVDISRATSGSHVDIKYYASNGEDEAVEIEALDTVTEHHRNEFGRIGIENLWGLIGYTPEEMSAALDIPRAEIETISDDARELLREQFAEREKTRSATSPDDLLLKEATGRYLHVMVQLVGSRQSSPELHALEAYCPRKSYLRYLPEIYRQTSQNSGFLEQYLSIFETVFTDIEANINRSTQYIDAYEIPKDYFPWLNRWFGGEAVLGRAWPEAAQRELLERSTDLYKLRGTKRGMLELIGLYFDYVEHREPPWETLRAAAREQLDDLIDAGYLTEAEAADRLTDYDIRIGLGHDEMIMIREYADIERIENDELRKQYADLFGHPRRFQVLIWPTLSDRHVGVIKTIINADKPVYSDVYVERLQKNFRVNTNTYLGINTYLPETQFGINESSLGADTGLQ